MPVFDYHDLRYHEVSFKASHNSYEREEAPCFTQLAWTEGRPHVAGCRGLELDIQQSPSNWAWSVAHIGGYSGSADTQLATYLRALVWWSEENRGHDVVTVLLDLKDTHFADREFPVYLDRYILDAMPRQRIFAPGDLMQGTDDLVSAVRTGGWPRLNDLGGRFIFCLSGNEERKATYAATDPARRLCFADVGMKPFSDPPRDEVRGDRVFYNFKLSDSYFVQDGYDGVAADQTNTILVATLEWFQQQQGLITRGYDLNTKESWQRAHRFGVNMLSTDKVDRHPWARVGDLPFVRAAAASAAGG